MAVTACAAGFLIEGFDGLWDGMVDDVADVWYVDAHPEGG